jgi:hypothetical protein
MQCLQCRRPSPHEERIASISGSIRGDEHTEASFLRPACGVYTVVSWWDDITGVESVNLSGPESKQEGGESVALITQCSEPRKKKCRCEARRRYFHDTLD